MKVNTFPYTWLALAQSQAQVHGHCPRGCLWEMALELKAHEPHHRTRHLGLYKGESKHGSFEKKIGNLHLSFRHFLSRRVYLLLIRNTLHDVLQQTKFPTLSEKKSTFEANQYSLFVEDTMDCLPKSQSSPLHIC